MPKGRPRKNTDQEDQSQQPDKSSVTVEDSPMQKQLDNNPKINITDKDEYNIEIIEDYYGKVDITYLSNKDPNYVYRYLRDDFKNLSIKTGNLLFQKGGWQIVPREHLQSIGIPKEKISPDGVYRVGDLILARMPKELFNRKEQRKKDEANAPVTAIQRMIDEGDPSTGGKDMHSTMKGIQTSKQLGMK